MFKYVAFMLMAACLFVLAGCSSIEDDWQDAKKVNTKSAYEAFLDEHPEGSYSDSARVELKFLEIIEAAGGSDKNPLITIEGVTSTMIGYGGFGPNGIRLSGPLVSITDSDETYWLIFAEPQRVESGVYRATGMVLKDAKHGKWFAVKNFEPTR